MSLAGRWEPRPRDLRMARASHWHLSAHQKRSVLRGLSQMDQSEVLFRGLLEVQRRPEESESVRAWEDRGTSTFAPTRLSSRVGGWGTSEASAT